MTNGFYITDRLDAGCLERIIGTDIKSTTLSVCHISACLGRDRKASVGPPNRSLAKDVGLVEGVASATEHIVNFVSH